MATKTVKLTLSSAGSDVSTFEIRDQSSNVIGTATVAELLAGKNFTVDNSVTQIFAIETSGCLSQVSVPYTDGTTKYYHLIACDASPSAYTTVLPLLANQRYVYPGISGSVFYRWDGDILEQDASLPPPSGWNGSMQRITGATGCP